MRLVRQGVRPRQIARTGSLSRLLHVGLDLVEHALLRWRKLAAGDAFHISIRDGEETGSSLAALEFLFLAHSRRELC